MSEQEIMWQEMDEIDEEREIEYMRVREVDDSAEIISNYGGLK